MSVIPPPPPQPPSANSGCFKWGAVTCGGLGCLGVVGIAVLVYFVMNSPMFKQAMGSVFQAQAAAGQLKVVGGAIDKFVTDKKRYPNQLKELIPNYLPSESQLQVQPTDSKSPKIWYRKPAKDAPPETVILQTKLTPPIPVPDAKPWEMGLRKNGEVYGTEYVYRDASGQEHRVDVKGL